MVRGAVGFRVGYGSVRGRFTFLRRDARRRATGYGTHRPARGRSALPLRAARGRVTVARFHRSDGCGVARRGRGARRLRSAAVRAGRVRAVPGRRPPRVPAWAYRLPHPSTRARAVVSISCRGDRARCPGPCFSSTAGHRVKKSHSTWLTPHRGDAPDLAASPAVYGCVHSPSLPYTC